MGFWAKSLRIFHSIRENGQQSIRRLAERTGLSKSSVHRHTQAMARRDRHPESWLWETEEGRGWLIRQRVAAMGRRVNTLCQGADGIQHQLALFHVYHNFVLPHASLRQPLRAPEPTNGRGSAKRWQSCTPAMAAGLTAHVWTLKDVLRYRVPPWPQLPAM